MLMVCHHLNPSVPEDLAFAESRIRPSTIAAEDVLHDLGAISMIGSDSQAMGRVGEVVMRTWQTAHVMKRRRGSLPGDGAADNQRARRYVAKYTICPAVAHGLDGEVGSVEPGKLADLVLWDPAFFGVRPHVVVKGGMIAWARWATPTPPSPPRSRCSPGRCSARTAAVAGHDVGRTSCRRRRSTTGWPTGSAVAPPAGRRSTDTPRRDQGRHAAATTRCPRSASTPTRSRSRVDGEVVEPDPAARAAHGPALLPVLRPAHACRSPRSCSSPTGGSPPAATRTPAGWRRRSPPAASTTPARLAGFLRGRLRDRRAASMPPRPAWPPRASAADALDAAWCVRDAERRRPDAVAGAAAGARARRAAALLRSAARPGRSPPSPTRRPPAAPAGRARRCSRRRPGCDPGRGRAGRAPTARRPAPASAAGCGCSALDPFDVRRRRCAGLRPEVDGVAAPTTGSPTPDDLPAAHRRRSLDIARRAPRRLGGPSLCILTTTTTTDEPPCTHRTGVDPHRAAAPRRGALRVGIGGPVGSGKTALVAALCRDAGAASCDIGRGDQRHLHDRGRRLPARATASSPPSASRAVETGCCPHTAIRDDITANLDAVEDLEARHGPARPGARRERRRQPHRHVQPRAWSTCRSSSSTSPAATRCRARAGPA